MKRFYKFVSIAETKDGYSILLDEKPIRTPAKQLLCTDSSDLANAILKEWMGQGDKIVLHSMPLTQMLNTRIDRISAEREAMTTALLKYLDTDLLCYRAEQPPEIGPRQAAAWDPWLLWFEKEFGIALLTTRDLKALKQPETAHKKVEKFVRDLDDDEFNVLQLLVPLSGSLVLAIAFVENAISPEEIFAACRVEEAYKAELYNEAKHGPDPMQEKKDKETLRDLHAAAQYLSFTSN